MIEFPIETTRLLLRPLSLHDAEDLFEVFGDPVAMRFLTAEVAISVEDTRQRWIQPKIDQQNRDGSSLWAVVERSSGRVVGDCGLQGFHGSTDVEIGVRVRRAFWGRGYGTEAAEACLRVGFEQLGLSRVVAETSPGNRAALQLLARLGLVQVSTTEQGWPFLVIDRAAWAAGAGSHKR